MESVHQLIKKDNQEGRYKDIFPKTFLDAVRHKETGKSLTEIMAGFNSYFVSYIGSAKDTRLQVPSFLRKAGLWLTYVRYDNTVITEWYIDDDVSDDAWGQDSNWQSVSTLILDLVSRVGSLESRVAALEGGG